MGDIGNQLLTNMAAVTQYAAAKKIKDQELANEQAKMDMEKKRLDLETQHTQALIDQQNKESKWKEEDRALAAKVRAKAEAAERVNNFVTPYMPEETMDPVTGNRTLTQALPVAPIGAAIMSAFGAGAPPIAADALAQAMHAPDAAGNSLEMANLQNVRTKQEIEDANKKKEELALDIQKQRLGLSPDYRLTNRGGGGGSRGSGGGSGAGAAAQVASPSSGPAKPYRPADITSANDLDNKRFALWNAERAADPKAEPTAYIADFNNEQFQTYQKALQAWNDAQPKISPQDSLALVRHVAPKGSHSMGIPTDQMQFGLRGPSLPAGPNAPPADVPESSSDIPDVSQPGDAAPSYQPIIRPFMQSATPPALYSSAGPAMPAFSDHAAKQLGRPLSPQEEQALAQKIGNGFPFAPGSPSFSKWLEEIFFPTINRGNPLTESQQTQAMSIPNFLPRQEEPLSGLFGSR